MRNPLFCFFVFLFCFSSTSLSAQIPLLSETFENSLGTALPFGAWSFSPTGRAELSVDLGNRLPIQSDSGPGAAVFQGEIALGHTLTLPAVNPVGAEEFYVKFNQYYRTRQDAAIFLDLSVDNGNTWQPFQLNATLAPELETSAYDVQVVDLVALNGGPLSDVAQVRFRVEGPPYFWVIDDVEFYDEFPFPVTLPAYLGDSLAQYGYQFTTDTLGTAYVEGQVVVQFRASTPEATRQAIRDTLGAVKIDSCVCDRLELWQMTDGKIIGPDGSPLGGNNSGITEKVKGATSSSDIDGIDFNFYNYDELLPGDTTFNQPLPAGGLSNLDPAPAGAVRIAILDTGLDNKHPKLLPFLYANDDSVAEVLPTDEDNNCYPDDPLGWNFVDRNNNTQDDHGHGTHVAGIVAAGLPACTGCKYQIIPYKTHDYHGVGNLFAAACATYQAAVNDSADIINDSWGYYGSPSKILENAIDTAAVYGAVTVAAAGNDGYNLADSLQYPIGYPAEGIVGVGAYDSTQLSDNTFLLDRWEFSNYGSATVDILAPGVDITSTLPNNTMGEKSGTSMAAPAVAAGLAVIYCAETIDVVGAKDFLLGAALQFPSDIGYAALDGNLYNPDTLCLVPVSEVSSPGLTYTAYPNPARNRLMVRASLPVTGIATITLHDAAGRRVLRRRVNGLTEYSLPLQGFRAGLYVLRVEAAGMTWVAKVLVSE
ncbi:MAG: S8 family peptidase [Saprospiraceae bacterium]